jgi:hypothetical protein
METFEKSQELNGAGKIIGVGTEETANGELCDNKLPETECLFLNSFGDISVKWKEKHNDEFIEEIDKLIKKGYTFFILKKDKKTKVKVDSASDINKRKVVIEKEKDLEALLKIKKNIKVEYIELESKVDTEGIARSGKEVVGKKVVAVKPAVGG